VRPGRTLYRSADAACRRLVPLCAAAAGLAGLLLCVFQMALLGGMCLWVAVELLVVTVQKKFYPAHFTPPLIPLALLWGLLLHSWSSGLAHAGHSGAGHVLPAGAGLLLAGLPATGIAWCFWRQVWRSTPEDYFLAPYRARRNPHLAQLIAAPEIGAYIQARTAPDDRIFVFGYCSSVYLYAFRRAALEFLEASLGTDPEASDSIWGNVWKWWVCRDIHLFVPRYIIDMDGRLDMDVLIAATGCVYRLETTFRDCFRVYGLVSGPAGRRFGTGAEAFTIVAPASDAYRKRLAIAASL
jgi:hypothetical protein